MKDDRRPSFQSQVVLFRSNDRLGFKSECANGALTTTNFLLDGRSKSARIVPFSSNEHNAGRKLDWFFEKRTTFRRPHFCSPTDGRARHAPTHRPFFLSTKSATLQVGSVALSFKWASCAPMNSTRREEIFGMVSWFDRLLSVHHIHSGRQMFPLPAHALAL